LLRLELAYGRSLVAAMVGDTSDHSRKKGKKGRKRKGIKNSILKNKRKMCLVKECEV